MTEEVPATRRSTQATHRYLWLAILLPLLVALVFSHPSRRIVIPDTIMLAITVVLTLLGGRLSGLLAVAASGLSIWFFNYPPGYSFVLVRGEDLVAVLLSTVVAACLVLLITEFLRRQDRAVRNEARLAARLQVQTETIAQMQRALLPEFVPADIGLPLGWHYRAGGESPAHVGGDWYAFVPVSRSCIGVAVGDVAGHGLRAVKSMAEYRFALRTLAVDRTSPDEVLKRLEEVHELYRGAHFSTCLYGLVDVERSTWTYASAGHPPPLLVRDGSTRILPAPQGPPIGTGLPVSRHGCETVALREGDLLALYTDGLVERRGESIDRGIDRLAKRISDPGGAADLSRRSADIVSDLVGDQPADDVALVLLRFTVPTTVGPTQ